MTTMERMKNDVVAFYKEKLKTESKDTALNQTLKRFWYNEELLIHLLDSISEEDAPKQELKAGDVVRITQPSGAWKSETERFKVGEVTYIHSILDSERCRIGDNGYANVVSLSILELVESNTKEE